MKTFLDATGEVLVITGGANGIGAGLARAYNEVGGTTVVFDIAPGADHQVDVSDRAAVFAAVEDVVALHGRIDGLVCAAAVQPRTDVVDTEPDERRRTLAVNLDGVVWCCQAVLPHMIARRRGSILMFASGLVHTGLPQASAYAASKGALVPFAKSLAAEVAEHRIRVNTVFPGVIDTPQFRAANPDGPQRARWAETTGIGTPRDVVGPLLFLLSDAATMTGSTLTRDRAYPEE